MSRKLATDPTALRSAVNDQLAGAAGAWAGGATSVDGFLRRVVADLDRMPTLSVHHAEFRHYGSGYASYADVFITKRDGSMRRSENGWTKVEGLPLALCRLAPLAALFKPDVHSSGPGGAGSRGIPELSLVTDTALPGWEEEFRQIRQVLDRHDIALLDSRVLGLPLEAELRVETVLGSPPYSVFDAWFRWRD
ncbi:hypothetical protein ETD86_26990 [Nonomuraea turkmeniaca]|uniref:Uncharacterized protein n=1 Tax=Nonomuraea turkmeniaca TaxID=103838 RepID=A0A5S4FCC1_9ACTN|nr:hypothetical protein [Nonomuraea turkmeniaca]TMR15510.1 hypothetical protein ETD86_26990 [Nonomuraea turkmeniaca]